MTNIFEAPICHTLYVINIELKPKDVLLFTDHCVGFIQLIITVLHAFGFWICWPIPHLKRVQTLMYTVKIS